MSNPISTTRTVRRLAFTTQRPWDDVLQALHTALGFKAGDPLPWMPQGNTREAIEMSVKAREGPSGLMLFSEILFSTIFNHFLPPGEFQPRVAQLVVGNALLAARLYTHNLRVPLLIPPRVVVIELPGEKGVQIVYDVPSTVLGNEDEEAKRTAEEQVDPKFEAMIVSIL